MERRASLREGGRRPAPRQRPVEHTLARLGAERLRELISGGGYVRALGASTGNQAVQQVQAGLEAVYVSGWQVAGDANLAGQMYPDQSLYSSTSVPDVVRRINQALRRADQIHQPRATTPRAGSCRSWPTRSRASAAPSTASS